MSQTQRHWLCWRWEQAVESKSFFMVSNLKLRSPFLLIASQPPACSDVGTSPPSWEESVSQGPRVTGQVTLLATWAHLPFEMRNCECYLPAINLERTGEGGD